MKTDELIGLLAADSAPVPRQVGERRLAWALGLGAALAVTWVAAVHGLRPDLAEVARTGGFALKMGLPLVVAGLGAVALYRLGHPGRGLGALRWGLALPVWLLWLMAALVWGLAEPAQRPAMLWGQTWRVCSLNVAMASLPAAVLGFWVLRGLAPTRPAWAGAAAGWMAGGVGAAAYALHCPETDLPFMAVWYVLGMALPALLGALAGRRWLRW